MSTLTPTIESKVSKRDLDAFASTTYPEVSPKRQVPLTPRSFALPMISPFIPVMLPPSIVEILRSPKDFMVSVSVAVPKIRGFSTNTPVIYAAKVKTCDVLNLAAISNISSAKRYSESGFAG